jgi:dTDP-4-dehydrorhamnose reductase
MLSADFKPTILVTGANGQLGREINVIATHHTGYHFLFAAKDDLPIEKKEGIELFFEKNRIDYCINCAAYTAVDKAESEKEKAFLINARSVEGLAEICKFHKAKLIHISTDYVYDGSNRLPLKETDAVGPVNVYGLSKLQGEELALKQNPSTLIIRTSWVYSSFGNNFVKTMLRLFKERDEINVVADQYGCPTYAADLANVIMSLIGKMKEGNDFSGIINYSNEGVTTWYEFAEEIKNISNSNCKINPIPTSSYHTAAQRPLYSVLDTSKIKGVLDLEIPFWKDSLKKCMVHLAE